MTKHYSLITFILFFSFTVSAQVLNYSFLPYSVMWDDMNHFQDPKTFHFNFKEMIVKSGKKTKRYRYNYDNHGKLVSYWEEKSGDNKKNKGFIVRYKSSQKKLMQRIIQFKNDKPYCSDSSVFNKFDVITLYLRYGKNNELKYRDNYTYDSTLIKEHIAYSYKKGNEKVSGREVYEYEPDLQLKKITYYNRKGKAYKKTVFDCNPIGVNRKISKDSTYKCVRYELDSLGNKIKITIENIKNRSTKVVTYFNRQNKQIAQKKFDLKKDRPSSFLFYNPETGAISKFIYFRKGKEVYRSETTFNAQNCIAEVITYSDNKPTSFFKNEFNMDGLVTKSNCYNRKHKLTRTVSYTYGLKE
jgi:hypothetical protein